MADETQLYCTQCQRNVLAKRKGTSHILHFLITIFTCGLWLLVWMGQSIRVGGWRCQFCGSTKLERPRLT